MDIDEIRIARSELDKLKKMVFRGPHPQKHLILYVEWLEKRLAEHAIEDMVKAVAFNNQISMIQEQIKGIKEQETA